MPRSLKLTLSYDGSNYSGWQRQINGPSVQAALEDELSAIVGTTVTIMAAGRTDAGVHAAGQVASVTLDHAIACDDLVRALNARLPEDVRVRHAEEMFARFDARIYAKSKTYRYAIWNGGAPNPFFRHVVWHVSPRLEVDLMSRAAARLVGEHDFVAFQAAGSDVKTTVRTLLALRVARGGHPHRPAHRRTPGARRVGAGGWTAAALRGDRHGLPAPHGTDHRGHPRGDWPRPHGRGRPDGRPRLARPRQGRPDRPAAGAHVVGSEILRVKSCELKVANPFLTLHS